MGIEKIPVDAEKSLGWGEHSQGLISCCEKATRDPGLSGGGVCGGAGYRCCRRAFALWWEIVLYMCVFIITIFTHWISLAVFVAPEDVVPWYTFLLSLELLLTTEASKFACLLNLRVTADGLTSKMRFVSEGVDAIFNDEGQCLGFWLECECGLDWIGNPLLRLVFSAQNIWVVMH